MSQYSLVYRDTYSSKETFDLDVGLINHVEQILIDKIVGINAVQGGDINDCHLLKAEKSTYFIKVNNDIKYPRLFEFESEGLETLKQIGQVKTPEVLAHGVFESSSFLLLEYLPPEAPSTEDWKELGMSLAKLHSRHHKRFGFHQTNYLGTVLQSNQWQDSWSTFYAEKRLLPLMKKCRDQGRIGNDTIQKIENICAKLDSYFPIEPSSLLHGDLWSGNVHLTSNGYYFIDPAVYYGHREMDIGMSLLFGGFDKDFYQAYQTEFHLEQGWESRVGLTHIYPMLVHVHLFGSAYYGQLQDILRAY